MFLFLKHEFLKKTLMDDYGWPNTFQHEAWQRDHERIFKEDYQLQKLKRNGINAPDELIPPAVKQQEESSCVIT